MQEYIAFTKMQGVGNDFVVINSMHRPSKNWPMLAQQLCDRRFGVGADGLLVLEDSQEADLAMRMYNPDGTEDVCGNGLRCVARFAVEHAMVEKNSLQIATLAGVRRAEVKQTPNEGRYEVTVTMGEPGLLPQDVPALLPDNAEQPCLLTLQNGEKIAVRVLSTGSAHAVTFVDELPGDEEFLRISPQVECHALFPERVSLMWCKKEAEGVLRLRIWERGAGETWGCGTGACAATVAAVLQGIAEPGEKVAVMSRGGSLNIVWQPGKQIEMTGPASVVFEGCYLLEL